jgi:hypothetical protein
MSTKKAKDPVGGLQENSEICYGTKTAPNCTNTCPLNVNILEYLVHNSGAKFRV